MHNSHSNDPWGDVLSEKPSHCTRIHVQNVNGFNLDRCGGQFDHYCSTHKEIQADISCGQEHKLDTTQTQVRSVLYNTVQQHWERSKLIFGTSPIPFSSHYKPGGTFMLATGSATGRVRKQHRDKWGRWVAQEYSGKNASTVMIISAYQPVDKRGKEGTTSVASQHRSLLLQTADPTDNPRVAFRRDLLEQLQEFVNNGFECLLVGDFNEEFGSDPDGIGTMVTRLGFVNIMAHRHPNMKPPVTYARGIKCLDFAMGTPRVAQSVIAAGYEAFNERYVSDHRGYFIDMDTSILFGNPTQDLATLSRRQLRTANVHHNTLYIDRLHEFLSAHRVFARAQKLTHAGDRHSFAEALDRDITAACLAAEARLPAIGEAAWSVELEISRKRVHALGKIFSTLRAGRDPQSIINNARNVMPSNWIPPTSQKESSIQWRAAKKDAATIAAESLAHREKDARERIRRLEQSCTASDKATATILRRIKKAEELKQLWKKLKVARQSTQPRGVVRLEIPLHPETDPKKCTEWQVIDVPTDIVRLLKERNHRHFGQAHGTPFTIPPLSDDLGFSGDGPGTQSILNGTYDTTQFSEPVQMLLNHLHYTHEMNNEACRPTISDAEFCGKLRVWRESTSTSPSGMHLGHYKVLVARHSFSTTADDSDLTPEFIARRDELNQKQTEIRSAKLALINYALERGYSYKRWQNIVNSILFKDPDNMRLHRTRIIHIYEADFNLAMGLKWRVATQQAEDLKHLNEGQYGSRTARSAIEPVYIEELQCEISRATRKPLVLTNYDASSCYDRIIPNLGMLVSQKYGVPATVTKATAETLRLAKYNVRTELGIAEDGYSHTDDSPVYGTGQGSTFSGQTWTFQSSTLIDCYDKAAYPAEYSSPSGHETVKIGIAGFVDDCNGQTNQFKADGSSSTVTELLRQAQHNAQTWTNLFSASGGALEVSKCSCHVLQFKFTAQGAPSLVPSIPNDQAKISVWDPNENKTHTIQVLNAYQAHKTLGHYKEPAGAQKEQYRQLQAKSEETTAFLWTCPLTRAEAWTFYYACYLTSVGYPLSCSSMSVPQLDTIQRKAMSIIVPRCGFNRNTKKEILYGPFEFGGASFRPLWVQQGVGQVTLFIRHWRKDTQSGKLSRIAMAWLQVQAGVSFQLLSNPSQSVPHLESKWFQSMRHFLATINASIEIDDFRPPKLQRLHDCVIMDVVLESGEFTDAEVRRINYCRLYLRAETLSDLTNVAGTSLDLNKLKGQWSLQSSRHHGNAIYQERPEGAAWTIWRRVNKMWSTSKGELHQPLGDWVIQNIHDHHQRHFCYWAWNFLWIRIEDGYVRCDPISAREFQESDTIFRWENIPSDATPMEATTIEQGIWKCTTATYVLVTGGAPVITFDDFIATLPPWERELLKHTTLSTDVYAIGVALEHGLRAVSDGSAWFQKQGSFGWILSSDTGERLAIGMGPASGNKPNSYRSEGYGMLALLSYLKRVAEFIHLHEQWKGIIATDSQSLINKVSNIHPSAFGPNQTPPYKRPLDPLSPEWDIVIGVQSLLKEMPGLTLQHIRGHQDNRCEFHRLPLLAQLNVEADELAATYQRDHGQFTPKVLFTKWAGVHLVLPTGTVTSKYESALRFQASARPLQEHIRQRNDWTSEVFDSINWQVHGQSLRGHIHRKTHLVKFVHEILPTNSKLHRNDPIRSMCPCCKEHKETWRHILHCAAPSRCEWRTNLINAVDNKCESLHTDPMLRQLLVNAISKWTTWPDEEKQYKYNIESNTLMSHQMARLISQQNAIGWHQLILGRFSILWSDIQDDYYATTINLKDSKRRSGNQWQKAIIGEIWSQWFILWELRNKDKHGSNESTRNRIEREEVERTIRDIYDLREQMEPSVQEVLCRDIADHFNKPLWFNKNWLAVHGPLVKKSIQRAKKKAIQGVRSIRQYFAR